MSNRCTLEQLRDMTAEQAACLPVEQIASLLEDVADRKADLKHLDDIINGALALRFSAIAASMRQAEGKMTGTVSIHEGEFVVRVDLPKKVSWDESGLLEVEKKLRAMNEPADEYIVVRRGVSEGAYQKWPSSLKSLFDPHRTVGVGKATYAIERAKRRAVA